MFQVKQESPFPGLADRWAAADGPDAETLELTREALAAVRPGDRAEVAPLVEILLGRLDGPRRAQARRALLALLDGARRRLFTSQLRPDDVDPWLELLFPVIARADCTLGEVLRSREETDPKTVAIRVLGQDACELTVADVARRTRAIARGILALVDDHPDARVAILSENCLEAALSDLACLTNGIVDYPLPANAVAEQVVFMLKHSGARVLLASDEEQVAKVLPSLPALPELREIVVFSRAAAERNGLLSLEQMIGQGADFDDDARAARAGRVRSGDVATVMYTSGTTGKPKGIVFTHQNLVTKRLARGYALREVGEGDVFLCYLPLYHTFGRWLELTGTLWWGATYVFARSTAQGPLLEDFKRVKPTVFISVPKKWMELHDAAVWEAASDDPDDVAAHLRVITGGRLRTGLSAAGYLDPVVFRAFHRAGTELCSGYGMTEATGGVTMTPVGEYVDGSIGKPLPGIECRRADDGELLIRGPYVSPGYYHPGPNDHGADADGWFGTGDLVSVDPAGHFHITGRKKEIYKNRQGQTIAPQRVENLFRDFEAISQAFLVGDHREYNTLLVWPNQQSAAVQGRSPDEQRELLGSLVASANRFLAPFERVVAFQVLPRALDDAHGELTHKLTFKREAVEKNWKDLIERMYEQKHLALALDGFFLRIPNWVLREMGVLQHEVALDGGQLRAGERSLRIGPDPAAPGALRIGDLAYAAEGTVIDLGALLARPSLWLGNQGLRAFLGEEAFLSLVSRRRKGSVDLRLDARLWPAPPAERLRDMLDVVDAGEVTFHSIHVAGELLRAERPEARRAISHLHIGLAAAQSEHASLCRALLRRAADAPDEDVRRRAFRVLLPNEDAAETLSTVRLFLDRMGAMALRDEDLADLGERGLSDAQVQVLLAHLASDRANAAPADPSDRRLLVGAMRLLTACAIAHPVYFGRVRVPLARLTLHEDPEVAARAGEELDRLRRGFSNFVGPNLRLAIDPQTGVEYGWHHVLVFDDSVPAQVRPSLLSAFEDATIVRASVFELGRGVLLSLADIPPGGLAVSLLGRQHGKSVYRVSIHTRAREVFDFAMNVAEDMTFAELRQEVNWLLAAGAPPPLVEKFGGYFAEWGIFTEEFIPGSDVERQVARLVRQGETRRLQLLWPFLVWTAVEGHVRFWDRTGRRLALREPSPAAFIVPSHDYHSGARLVSISDRSPCAGFDELLDRFEDAFIERIERSRPELRGGADEAIVLSAVVEALGLERGVALLEEVSQTSRRAVAIETFLERLREGGFTPQRVHFAARRYRRWLDVNPQATFEAQGKMLGELWGTYRLSEVETAWPDTRVRFFRQTVFAGVRPELGAALDRIMNRARVLPAGGLDLEEQVAAVRSAARPTSEEDYFLARMTYRYLAPTDEVALISMPSGGHYVTEVVVALTDEAGERFTVRGPVSPREVARLLHMFHESNLQVTFTTEHEFLLCLDPKDTVIGGLFYRQVAPDRVHMEKLVVGRRLRGRGVADGLMREFARRLKARGVRRMETGYFQPEYLRRFGFRTDPTSGGLVREIEPDDFPL
ncbi:GNAT family N-acetyltransferase [Anaeromyxobacter dehalogenans]|uniref:GNAT family N-acetyltransferase n=1 Tax=Anaeromyxobacter dehalogenans TaxID=161493 RepID=UPI0002F1D534|nr:GNAT family N-acetyltransferase [Anaeromyxobacter dehalogenans]